MPLLLLLLLPLFLREGVDPDHPRLSAGLRIRGKDSEPAHRSIRGRKPHVQHRSVRMRLLERDGRPGADPVIGRGVFQRTRNLGSAGEPRHGGARRIGRVRGDRGNQSRIRRTLVVRGPDERRQTRRERRTNDETRGREVERYVAGVDTPRAAAAARDVSRRKSNHPTGRGRLGEDDGENLAASKRPSLRRRRRGARVVVVAAVVVVRSRLADSDSRRAQCPRRNG